MLFKRRCWQSSKNEIMNYFLEVNLGDQSKSLLLQLRGVVPRVHGCTGIPFGSQLNLYPPWHFRSRWCNAVTVIASAFTTTSGTSAYAAVPTQVLALSRWLNRASVHETLMTQRFRSTGLDPRFDCSRLERVVQYVVWPSYDAPVKLLTITKFSSC